MGTKQQQLEGNMKGKTARLSIVVLFIVGMMMASETVRAQNGTPANILSPVSGPVRVTRSLKQRKSKKQPDFDALSGDLVLMRELFQGGNAQPVTFDSEAAHHQGFSSESIKLAEEITAYSNDLSLAASNLKSTERAEMSEQGEAVSKESVDVTQLDVDVENYPLLQWFFDKATERRNNLAISKKPLTNDESQSSLAVQGFMLPGTAELVCGSFGNPRPSAGAFDRWHRNVRDPKATLKSWGYHQTPSTFAGIPTGGGWTRAQTYSPLICGLGTYRDHAAIPRPNLIQEQNYEGWTPRGEPNPEVWLSGPWPYPYWPAYVRWWHSRY
jgi:hypothetical protein